MYEELKKLLIEEMQIEEEKITPEAELVNDLGFNSLELAELVIHCEETYDVEFDEEETYTIVGSTETDPDANKISDESPIGIALMGKKVGDTVQVETPGGTIELKILEISK